jgi:hypothetical protein
MLFLTIFLKVLYNFHLDIYIKVKDSEIEECENSFKVNMVSKDSSKVGLEM